MKRLGLMILPMLYMSSAQADPSIRAALLERTTGAAGIGYSLVYGETASLERGTDVTSKFGYDFVCRLVAEENLQLVAYREGTWDAVASETISLHKGEAVLTLERGRLLYSCYVTE